MLINFFKTIREKKIQQEKERLLQTKAAEFESIIKNNRKYKREIVDQWHTIQNTSSDEMEKVKKVKEMLEQSKTINFFTDEQDFCGYSFKFMYYFAALLSQWSYALSGNYRYAFISSRWSFYDGYPYANINGEYFKDRYIELFNYICYNSRTDLRGSTTMLFDFAKFIRKDELQDSSSEWCGMSEKNLHRFEYSDYCDLLKNVETLIVNSNGLTNEQRIYMIDYASYVIAKDMQSHMSITILYDQYYQHFKDAVCFPLHYYDENGKCVDLSMSANETIEVDLCKLPTFSTPDKINDLAGSIAHIKNNGFISEDKNNKVLYLKPLNICVVESGNHHIAAAIANGSCVVEAKVVDLTPIFSHIDVTEERTPYGSYCCWKYDNGHAKSVKEYAVDGRVAALYKIAQMKMQMLKDIEAEEKKSAHKDAMLSRPYFVVKDIIISSISRLKNGTVLDASEIATMEMVSYDFVLKAILEAEKLGLVKRKLLCNCNMNGRMNQVQFDSIEDVPKYGDDFECQIDNCSCVYCKSSTKHNLILAYVRTNMPL